MTIVRAHDLTRHDLHQLGTNLAATVRGDRADLDAVNHSLEPLGESVDPDELDPVVEAACRSEHVAS